MKKVFSLALALVMMFAICVPAFAAIEYENDGGAGSTTKVVLLGSSATATYTVTIPATVDIYWEQTSTNVNYSIFSQMETGTYVKVTVESADNGVMTNGANATLNYSLSDTTYTTTESVIDASTPEEATVKVLIPLTNWQKASIDNYSGTLTFKAELTTQK